VLILLLATPFTQVGRNYPAAQTQSHKIFRRVRPQQKSSSAPGLRIWTPPALQPLFNYY